MFICIGGLVRHYQQPKKRSAGMDWVGTLERIAVDARFKSRGARPVSGDVGVLAIDEESVAKFGRWPFQRSIYERALANLKKAGVQIIGFDVIFSEPERPYLDESIEDIQDALSASIKPSGFDTDVFGEAVNTMLESSKGDLSFSKGLKDFGKIIHGYFFFEANTTDGLKYDWVSHFNRLKNGSEIDLVSYPKNKALKDYPEMMIQGALTNTPVIAEKGSRMGFFNNTPDPDGIVRSSVLLKGLVPIGPDGKEAGEPILLPTLALVTAASYLNREIMVKFDDLGVSSVQLMDPNGEADPLNIPLNQDGLGSIHINHYGPGMTFPHISLADAYDGKLPKKGIPKLLLVGAVGTGLADIRPSPFSELFNGVEHHTAVLENILSTNFLQRPISAFFIEMGVMLFSGLFFAFVLQRVSAVASAMLLVTFSVGLFYVDKYFFFAKGQWIYIGMIYLQSFSLFFSVTLFKYFTEEKEKKKIKNAFQHYLNPAVINELMDNPDSLKLGGEKKELTVFFSDVRGFTTISETLSPEALTGLLNEYFTPMTNIILESGGLLDKYIGDAVMAVWGAPINLPDPADRALQSSLKMLDALDVLRVQWQERGLPLIDIGCGINTGPMVVGNMGSNQRFDYTVLGDAVNLGARLEGVTKQYGVKVICSEFTLRSLKNPSQFVFRDLDSIQVKGKNEPVQIYEVMRIERGNFQLAQDIAGLFAQGREAYKRQAWADAEKIFAKILSIRPGDGPAEEYMERCRYLREHAPGDAWNGVWVMKTK
jgi:adenylate cyclase